MKQNKISPRLINADSASGLLLLLSAVLAMLIANSPLAAGYLTVLDFPISIRAGVFEITKPLLLWINDGLMALFFLHVGVELKHEMMEGHLATWRQRSLPAFAALGGMLTPAIIYCLFNAGDAIALRGWAIPTATDIAFAVGVLSLFGSRVPAGLKIFLLSVAIFDDLGAIIIIAFFYTAELSWTALSIAALMIAVLVLLNRLGVMRAAVYCLLGIALWVAILKSGIHATLAGVILAACLPLHAPGTRSSPLKQIEHALRPWVLFLIMPVFALANAGVPVGDFVWSDLLQPIPLGIMVGLLVGKQAGILLASYLAVRTGLAHLPRRVDWRQLYAIAVVCGIGFTMSLFISSLAFVNPFTVTDPGLERLGILLGSLLSGIWGYAALRRTLPPPEKSAA